MLTGKKSYPTAKEIMDPPVLFNDKALEEMMAWKLRFFPNWNQKKKEEQLEALSCLVKKLCVVYEVNVSVNKYGDQFCFSPGDNIIHLDKENPSIISTLHEFRHRVNGPDEKSACRWSVQLFKRCFPGAFERLEFYKGTHILTRKKMNDG